MILFSLYNLPYIKCHILGLFVIYQRRRHLIHHGIQVDFLAEVFKILFWVSEAEYELFLFLFASVTPNLPPTHQPQKIMDLMLIKE